jgi:hypothetical protein
VPETTPVCTKAQQPTFPSPGPAAAVNPGAHPFDISASQDFWRGTRGDPVG